jgi:ABC-type nitrate/sulfonate/bicarbonate transport system permease component
MHGFFPMVIITMSAIQTIPNIYLKVGRSLMMTQYQVARHVIAPYLVVQLIVGIRLAFSLTFLGVILAELFAANTGIGLQLRHAMANFDTQKIMAIVTVLMLIAFIGNITFYLIQRSLERRWNLSARETL